MDIPKPNAPDAEFEALWLTCPDRIARGSNRDVYAIPSHPDKVLKVTNRQSNFPNWTEITTYTNSDQSEYLARIFTFSASGKFLIMEKLKSVTHDEIRGLNFPIYMKDRKSENFGRDQNGEIKILDYGLLDFSRTSLTPIP